MRRLAPRCPRPVQLVHRVAVDRSAVVLVLTPENEDRLLVARVDRKSERITSLEPIPLGPPARVYGTHLGAPGFPRLSELIDVDGTYVLVWVHGAGALMLSTWGSTAMKSVMIGDADTNSAVSIGVIGRDLLAAFHTCRSKECRDKGDRATIKVVARRLSK
jgi:hypothetical protein